jgi:hypothetical protein
MSLKRVGGLMLVATLFGIGLAEGGGCSSSSPAMGGETQACYANDTCNAGLTCASHKCVKAPGGSGGSGGNAGATSTAGSTGSAGAAGTTSTAGAGGSAGATAGAGGATAGAGGSVAGAGGATAGAGGSVAGAGGSAAGAGGSAAGAGGAAAGAGGTVVCGVTPSYGPVTFAAAAQQAVGYGDAANGPSPDEVDWDATLNNDVKPDVLDFTLFAGQDPFAAGITTKTIDLAGQDDLKTCGACVLLIAHADTNMPLLRAGDDYIATSGTLMLTAVPTLPITASSRVTGTLTNVVFKHVKINPTSFVTTKIDDCKVTVTSANFDSLVVKGP